MLRIFLVVFLTAVSFSSAEKVEQDTLINAQQFLDGNYFQEFLQKAQADNEQKGGPLDKYLLSWVPLALERLGGQEEEINGSSEKFVIMVAPIPLNDGYVEKTSRSPPAALVNTPIMEAIDRGGFDLKGEKINCYPAFYRSDQNLLYLDPRINLPPNLWAVTIFQELRHGFDEVVILKNDFPEDKKSLVELEIKGRIAGLLIWGLVKDDFLKTWTKKVRDHDPAYLSAKLMLFDLICTEPLAEEYLNGQPKGLEKYLEGKIWLPKE